LCFDGAKGIAIGACGFSRNCSPIAFQFGVNTTSLWKLLSKPWDIRNRDTTVGCCSEKSAHTASSRPTYKAHFRSR
ncbi:hypothetical protein Tco_1205440, partial [Tanacetum coccineum]